MYKLLSSSDGYLKSYSPIDHGEVTYLPGEWVSAPPGLAGIGYHLVVLETMDHARSFMGHNELPSYVELWECEVRDIVSDPPPCWGARWDYTENRFFITTAAVYPWFPGTVMVKGVKITKNVSGIIGRRSDARNQKSPKVLSVPDS